MNHRNANLLNAKDWREHLKAHPDNKSLKKWLNRVELAEKDRKAGGVPKKFEIAWAAYNKRGHKQDSIDAWNKMVLDEDLVIACIPRYLKECKDSDTPILHFQRWLLAERWEQYEQVKEKVIEKRKCKICKTNPAVTQISYKSAGVWFGGNVCTECKQYDGMEYADGKWEIAK